MTDITYIPTDEDWLYLAGHKDLFSGDLVGYAMSKRMTRNLVSQSLFRSVAAKRPPRGLIHHSDRGSQYCAHEYKKLLDQFGMVPSMSRRGGRYDSAPMKNLRDCSKMNWCITGASRPAPRPFRSSPNTSRFYRRQRKQTRFGYLFPVAFERQFYENRLAA